MAFTMHSHSGQFCPGHAKDSLEAIVLRAISTGYKTIGLTEHMPRNALSDLYPEELEPSPEETLASLFPRHEAYVAEAVRLQIKYADKIHVLIGFESEWIRPEYKEIVERLAAYPNVDYFIGSLHHAKGVPIDFDDELYEKARIACGGGGDDDDDDDDDPSSSQTYWGEAEGEGKGREQKLFEAYFDEQHEMLKALKPKIVGHFDLIRLFSCRPGRVLKDVPAVWEKVVRNLEVVREYGGWLELNTSAFRKGLDEGYPKREIAEEWIAMGGKFTFSDDCHGVAQVSTNYLRGLEYLEGMGVKEVWTLERLTHPGIEVERKSELAEKAVSIDEFRASLKVV